MTRQPSFRDINKLSAHLDGQLSRAETTRLESHLASDPVLAAALEAMHQSRTILRRLPQRRAPRNFTLTPKMAGLRGPLPRAVPILRFATVLTTILLTITFAANTLAPMATGPRAAMPYGIGGGGAEGPAPAEEMLAAEAPPPAAAPTTSPANMPSVTPTPESDVSRYGLVAATPTNKVSEAPTEAAVQDMANQQIPESKPSPQLVPSAWQTGLFAAAIIFGLTALFLYWNNQRLFRIKLKKHK